MSTRAWYEYYVLNRDTRRLSLAMQFYKWGNGTPENALWEYRFFRRHLEANGDCLPIVWVDDLLKDQLGELYNSLPSHFTIGAFFFLLQRAREEGSDFRSCRYLNLPKTERPDYRLGYDLGRAEILFQFPLKSHADPDFERLRQFIATGYYIRPWSLYGTRWSVLQWLQYLTQITLEIDMGSIAGETQRNRDISHIYRFFYWTQSGNPLAINRIGIQLCDAYGDDLLPQLQSGEDEDEDEDDAENEENQAYAREQARQLQQTMRTMRRSAYTLRKALQHFSQEPDTFWQLPERPDLKRDIDAYPPELAALMLRKLGEKPDP